MLILTLFLFCVATQASPVPAKYREVDGKVLYDQRQEGEWNVRADLKNFLILIIPTKQNSSPPTGAPTLLDFISKSVPKAQHVKAAHPAKTEGQETIHFIESKTAPYHVDLTKTKLQEKKAARLARAVVLNVPEEKFVLSSTEDHKKVVKKDNKKKVKDVSKEMTLLGSENEQCGPGLIRDSLGICRVV